MQSDINIRTLTGDRIDISPNTSVELNMGGISLLSLEDRPIGYTNSFRLPRTPMNDKVFEFACLPNRSNRPKVDVIIESGAFQERARLIVMGGDNSGYDVSVSYRSLDVIEDLKTLNVYYLPSDGLQLQSYGPTTPSQDDYIADMCNASSPYFYPIFRNHYFKHDEFLPNNCAMSLTELFSRVALATGYNFYGSLLTDSYFQNGFILLRSLRLRISYISGIYYLVVKNAAISSQLFFSDVLKTICQIFFADMKIEGNSITLNKLSMSGTVIDIDGFDSIDKMIYTGYGQRNYIRYDVVDKSLTPNQGGDYFVAEGVGDKEVFKMKAKIPKYYSYGDPTRTVLTTIDSSTLGGYDDEEDIANTDIVIMSSRPVSSHVSYDGIDTVLVPSAPEANILSMSGVYSTPLTPVFHPTTGRPSIVKVRKILTQLEARYIMNYRLILSRELSGTFFVDSMSYNLSTGNAVLTLIKTH